VSVRLDQEWLEADGLGGFASGTAALVRTRRYHGLLLVATTPPTGRVLLVAGHEAWLQTPQGRIALSSHFYAPDVEHPDGRQRLTGFRSEPCPQWTWSLPDGATLRLELLALHDSPRVLLHWSSSGLPAGCSLAVRPLLAGRDPHALHHENGAIDLRASCDGQRVRWRPYADWPAVVAAADGPYVHGPDWYRSFLLPAERERGFPHVEDLATPGEFHFPLEQGEAWLLLSAESGEPASPVRLLSAADVRAHCRALRDGELARRQRFASPLERAADAYLVRRGSGSSLVAGYPWFADWGRDTFIALRGLVLATGRVEEAGRILEQWSLVVSQGMLPNCFTDQGSTPEYNSVDASLWFVVAVHEYCEAAGEAVPPGRRQALTAAVLAIVSGYAAGTRYGIRADHDGLLAAGEPGWQLTWMDARSDGREVTPRIGKPVEVQALWISALSIAGRHDGAWATLADTARASFGARFWNERAGRLYDVVDVGHVAGAVDASFRPNQVLAVGGLPFRALEDEHRAAAVVAAVEAHLWTPLGLRTLERDDPAYEPRYEGGPAQRDAAYHQGTVWPWLLGPFVEAWIAVHGADERARREADERFVQPLLQRLAASGCAHVPELADAEAPHAAKGCPFQAWSLGELLRLQRLVLVPARSARRDGPSDAGHAVPPARAPAPARGPAGESAPRRRSPPSARRASGAGGRR